MDNMSTIIDDTQDYEQVHSVEMFLELKWGSPLTKWTDQTQFKNIHI